jgi:hypothetical protein
MSETSADKSEPSEQGCAFHSSKTERTAESVNRDTQAQRSVVCDEEEGEEQDLHQSSARPLSQSQLLGELNVLHVRRVVAGNPNTPRQVLLRLAEDRSVLIRSAVAANPKSPPDLLRVLSTDESSEVRLAVAENINAPWELLLKVAGDTDADVRFGMAENPYMPEEILLALLQDENPFVAWRAIKTLDMLNPDTRTKLNSRAQRAAKGTEHGERHGLNPHYSV